MPKKIQDKQNIKILKDRTWLGEATETESFKTFFCSDTNVDLNSIAWTCHLLITEYLGASLNFTQRQVPFSLPWVPALLSLVFSWVHCSLPLLFHSFSVLSSLSCCFSSCVGIWPQVIFSPESGIFSESLQWCSEGTDRRVWESGLWGQVAWVFICHLPLTLTGSACLFVSLSRVKS